MAKPSKHTKDNAKSSSKESEMTAGDKLRTLAQRTRQVARYARNAARARVAAAVTCAGIAVGMCTLGVTFPVVVTSAIVGAMALATTAAINEGYGDAKHRLRMLHGMLRPTPATEDYEWRAATRNVLGMPHQRQNQMNKFAAGAMGAFPVVCAMVTTNPAYQIGLVQGGTVVGATLATITLLMDAVKGKAESQELDAEAEGLEREAAAVDGQRTTEPKADRTAKLKKLKKRKKAKDGPALA